MSILIIKPNDFNPFTLSNSFLINLKIIFNDIIPKELISIIFSYWEEKMDPIFLTNLLGLKTVFNNVIPTELINIIIKYWKTKANVKPFDPMLFDPLLCYAINFNTLRVMAGFAGISYSN